MELGDAARAAQDGARSVAGMRGAPGAGRVSPTTARPNPLTAQRGESLSYIVALRPTGVIDSERRLAAGERDLPHRHPDAVRPST